MLKESFITDNIEVMIDERFKFIETFTVNMNIGMLIVSIQERCSYNNYIIIIDFELNYTIII